MEPFAPTLEAALAWDRQLDLVKWTSTLALCRGNRDLALEQFSARWPGSRSLALLQKAAVTSATTTDPAWAGALVTPALQAPFAQTLKDVSLFARMGATLAPAGAKIPTTTADPLTSVSWIGEGLAKPFTTLAQSTVALPATKLATIIAVSEELARLAYPGSTEYLTRLLVNATRIVADRAALDPTSAATAARPASLTNGIATTPPGSTVSATAAAVIAALFTARPNAERPTLICSPATCARLAGEMPALQLSAAGGVAFGLPVVPTSGAGAILAAVDAGAIAYADGGAVLDQSTQAFVEMSNAPTTPPGAGANLVSLWQSNLIGFRVERAISWAAAAGAVAWSTAP